MSIWQVRMLVFIMKMFTWNMICRIVAIAAYFPRLQGSWGQHGAVWGRQDPGGPHVVPMNFATWVMPHLWGGRIEDKRLKSRNLSRPVNDMDCSHGIQHMAEDVGLFK